MKSPDRRVSVTVDLSQIAPASSQGKNAVLDDPPPPPMNDREKELTRKKRATFSQLMSDTVVSVEKTKGRYLGTVFSRGEGPRLN